MEDNRLAAEEARRSVQHEAVKGQVESEVQSEIAERAARTRAPGETERVSAVASEFRGRAVDEVVETEREVQRGRGLARVSQIVDYVFYLIYALLMLRFVLALLAARSSAGFVRFVTAVSEPFYAPFRGIVAAPTAGGGYTLLLPVLVALLAYFLLHLAINGLLRLLAHRKTQI